MKFHFEVKCDVEAPSYEDAFKVAKTALIKPERIENLSFSFAEAVEPRPIGFHK